MKSLQYMHLRRTEASLSVSANHVHLRRRNYETIAAASFLRGSLSLIISIQNVSIAIVGTADITSLNTGYNHQDGFQAFRDIVFFDLNDAVDCVSSF